MPKLLVLFQSRSPDVIALAEAAADGARTVRFAEVDLRRLGEADTVARTTETDGAGRVHRSLERVEDIAAYDGVILALPTDGGDVTATIAGSLEVLGGALANKVGSVVASAEGAGRNTAIWAALTVMADRGMILVPAPFASTGGTAADSARQTGRRVAEVIGWVTHARSHHHHEPHHSHHSHHQH